MNSFLRIAKALFSHIVVLAIVQFLCGVVSLSAQNPPTKKRQTIGLALQGGGALGLAHVGVITWLEEHHIPVDYVAGTSMGGLVGGAFATGRNGAELHQLVDGIQWDQVMSGQTPFDYLSFRRKQDARDYPYSLEFGIR